MAWSGRHGGAPRDSGLELSLGLPAYSRNTGLAGEDPTDAAAASAFQTKASNGSSDARTRPAAAAPVVGWPPVRSFRRNLGASRPLAPPPPKPSSAHQDGGAEKGALFVKINMDGVPIGRKVDLRAYGGYADLSAAVGKLFRGLLAAQQRDPAAATGSGRPREDDAGVQVELAADSRGEYTLVYEDEEGDRVLVGDVPWEMFVATAKRLRVLKSSDLPPKAGAAGRKRAEPTLSFCDTCCKQ